MTKISAHTNSRRQFLGQAAGLGAAAGLLAGPPSLQALCAAAAPDAAEKKILLIGHKLDHPPATHMYLRWCELLAKCLEQTPGVKPIVSDGWPKDEAALRNLAAIFTYGSPGADRLLVGEVGQQFEALLKQGVGFAALHWGTGIKTKDEAVTQRWLDALGGYWRHFVGLTITNSKVEQTAKDHAICRGWSDFEVKDEFYLNPTIAAQSTPLWKVKVKDKNDAEPKDVVVAWACQRPDGGRSHGNTLGHFHPLLGMEPFCRAVVNGILWVARCEVPKGGAPCALSEKDLELPPAPPKAAKGAEAPQR